MGYITEADFTNARTGIDISALPAGELTNYINRASAAIEAYCNRRFVAGTYTEVLRSAGSGRARIGPDGILTLYPIQAFPINAVTAITWRFRAIPLAGQTSFSTTSTTVNSNDVVVETDEYGYGWRIVVYEDFSNARHVNVNAEFTVTYNGGFVTVPDWLKEATIEWTAHLLKKRGAQAIVMEGTGLAVDQSSLGGHLQAARDILNARVRRF